MLYVIGGRNADFLCLDVVEMFDAWHGEWVTCAPLPMHRVSSTAVALPDGRLLVAGGYDKRGMFQGLLATCEIYDPRAQAWQSGGAASMQRARWGHGSAALGSKVYVIGGCSSFIGAAEAGRGSMETLACCEVYDPESDSWSPIAPLNVARSGARVVAVEGRYLAVVGGCADIFGQQMPLDSVEIYDPSTGSWTLLTQGLDQARPTAGVAAIEDGSGSGSGQVFVFGGAGAPQSAEIFDVKAPTGLLGEGAGGGSEKGPRHAAISDMGAVLKAPEGRTGCQAVAMTLPAPGKRFPVVDRPSIVVIGGEGLRPSAQGGVPERAFLSGVLAFDVATGAWRNDAVMPPMPTPRTSAAICMGEGYPRRV